MLSHIHIVDIDNKITNDGAKLLLKVLEHNTFLKELDLGGM